MLRYSQRATHEAISNQQTAYRARFYKNYAGLQRRTHVGQIRRDLTLRAPYLRRLVKQFFPANRESNILDLGCGCGALVLFLHESGYHNVMGIENSPDQVEFARQLGAPSVVAGDLVPFLRNSATEVFDVVIAFDVIEHFCKEEVLEIMDQAYRVLRPGGRLIVHAPNAEGIFGSRIFWSDFTHEMAFTRESLRQLTCASGFGSIEFSEDLPVVHGVKSLIRRVLWAGLRSIFRLAYIAETGDSGAGLILTQNLLAVAIKN
jgi:2-polyprenyl-3-methyl-5-hydroxy-6-metoxy-1,4-benzoquinol methylase